MLTIFDLAYEDAIKNKDNSWLNRLIQLNNGKYDEEVLIMFVKLKENITHKEFIIYTFGKGIDDHNKYDLDYMKNNAISCTLDDYDIYRVQVKCVNVGDVVFSYERTIFNEMFKEE